MIIAKPEVLRLRGSTRFDQTTGQTVFYDKYVPMDAWEHPYTMSAWLRPTGDITGNPYIGTAYSTSGATNTWGWRLYSIDSGSRILAFRPNSRYAAFNATIDWDEWHHYAYTDLGGIGGGIYQADNIEPYKDGIAVGRSSSSGGSSTETHPDEFRIGTRNSGGAEFDGAIAHYGIWRRMLLPSEIAWLAKGHSPLWFPNGLVFYAPLTDRKKANVVDGKEATTVTYAYNSQYAPPETKQPAWIDYPQRFFNFPVGATESTLVVDDLSQSNAVDKVGITKESTLAIDNLSQVSDFTAITLTQAHNLSLKDLSQESTVEKKSLTLTSDLIVNDLSQSNQVEKASIEPEGSVIGYALAQANIVSVPSLTQTHVIAVNNLTQSNLVEKPWVNTAYQLSTINITQANTFSVPTLTQVHNLAGLGLSQANGLQLIYLGEWWYERHEDIGLATITYSVVGYVLLVHEEYALIDQEYDIDAYIDQQLDGDGEIEQEHGQDAPVAVTYEQDGEI